MLNSLVNLEIWKKNFHNIWSGFRDRAKRIFHHLREVGLASTGHAWWFLLINLYFLPSNNQPNADFTIFGTRNSLKTLKMDKTAPSQSKSRLKKNYWPHDYKKSYGFQNLVFVLLHSTTSFTNSTMTNLFFVFQGEFSFKHSHFFLINLILELLFVYWSKSLIKLIDSVKIYFCMQKR